MKDSSKDTPLVRYRRLVADIANERPVDRIGEILREAARTESHLRLDVQRYKTIAAECERRRQAADAQRRIVEVRQRQKEVHAKYQSEILDAERAYHRQRAEIRERLQVDRVEGEVRALENVLAKPFVPLDDLIDAPHSSEVEALERELVELRVKLENHPKLIKKYRSWRGELAVFGTTEWPTYQTYGVDAPLPEWHPRCDPENRWRTLYRHGGPLTEEERAACLKRITAAEKDADRLERELKEIPARIKELEEQIIEARRRHKEASETPDNFRLVTELPRG